MNTKKILGGSVAPSLTFAVGSASADDVQYYGADDLAVGFGSSPIDDVSIGFSEGDPSFDIAPTTELVTQSVTATFDVNVVSDRFFKAAIEVDSHYEPEPEDPWEDPDE